MQGHMLEKGSMSREVIVKDFAGYKAEGAGRFGLNDEDTAARAAHLGL